MKALYTSHALRLLGLVGALALAGIPGCNCATPATGAACLADGGCAASGYVCNASKVCVAPDGGRASNGSGTTGGASGTTGSGGTAGTAGTGSTGGTGGKGDGGPPVCLATGAGCQPAGSEPCCSGVCSTVDGGTPVCAPPTFCFPSGVACLQPTDCCSNSCVGGQCVGAGCVSVGGACGVASDCCSDTCVGGSCQALGGGCGTLGNSCTTGAQCCSTNCQGGTCVRAYLCNASGDICFSGTDCCSGLCSANDGGPGTCQTATASGAGGCTVDGEPCTGGGTNCCSRLCVDPGSGVAVCAPASGCRLTGDLCTKDSDCRGGPPTDMQVTCSLISTNPPVGRCTNPSGSGGNTGCEPVGDICGANGSNARQDCCDGKKAVCKIDSEGISRCFGGGGGLPDGGGLSDGGCPTGYSSTDPSCCIPAGANCQFRDQCCDQAPCLPTPDGGFVCAFAPTCLAAGTDCGGDAGACCNGLECAAAGEFGMACQYPVSAPDGGTAVDGGGSPDGGSADAGPACLADQSPCLVGAECCSGYCFNGICSAEPTCQPQGSTCTSSADCCIGLSCSIPGGSASGTCQAGTSCAQVGQSCALTTDCCLALTCDDATGAACTAGASCTCQTLFH